MKLNLGSADRHIDGFISVDLFRPENAPSDFQEVNLSGLWPWETSSVDEVRALDIAEHVGDERIFNYYGLDSVQTCLERMKEFYAKRHQLGRIHFMNELHRVLKPGAVAIIEVPNATRGVGFTCDPTHVTQWCLSSFKYFEAGAFAHQRLSKAYGITAAFKIRDLGEYEVPAEDPREKVWKIHAELEAAK